MVLTFFNHRAPYTKLKFEVPPITHFQVNDHMDPIKMRPAVYPLKGFEYSLGPRVPQVENPCFNEMSLF